MDHILIQEIRDFAIFMLDTKGCVISWNKGAQNAKGYTKDEVLGKHFSLFYTEKEKEVKKPDRILWFAKEKGKYEEDGIRLRKDGSQYWANIVITALRDDKGKLLGYANISREITAQKKVVTDLKNMKYALDQSSIVAITDRNGMIEYVNDKFVEISKYERSELIGKTHRVINSKHHSKEYMDCIWKTILSGKVWRGEIQNRAKDGTYYWVDTTITPLMDEYGKPKQFIAIRNDITKRKKLERQKDEFIGIASHELKTPLTSLKGYIQLMHKRCEKFHDETATLFISKMEKQIDKLNFLVQDLLDVTRIESDKLSYQKEKFNFNELVKDIIDTMQYTTNKHAVMREGSVDRDVFGDKDRIGQVLINLLSNAIKYSPEAKRVEVKLSSGGNSVNVCVKDYGIGIPKEQQKNIFKRFYRVEGVKGKTFPGLGLGLYISSEIIRRHDGKMWFESEPEKGSLFCFSLPYPAHIFP